MPTLLHPGAFILGAAFGLQDDVIPVGVAGRWRATGAEPVKWRETLFEAQLL